MHSLEVSWVPHVFYETINVQLDRGGVSLEIVELEGVLVLEQTIVHLPEEALLTRCFGSNRTTNREGVDIIASEMAEYEACPQVG